ncbi:hypothetical protein [uncultured Rothia sp.]|uniref:hypothetical protein n=1 Tax=uncultured Rothia sp. TaxID=316088 RepID=UPI0026351024|nr:hypothetical protein [uncultured Rothia sp.]
MTTARTIRTAKALAWACVLAFIILVGIGTAQEDIGLRAVVFVISLIPVGPAVLTASFVHAHNRGEPNG